MKKILNRSLFFLDSLNEYLGRALAWLTVALVAVVCIDVFARYLLKTGSALFPELEWHLFSMIFLLGAGYTLRNEQHVRVDVLYSNFSPLGKAWLNLIGHLVLLLPFCIVLIYISQPLVYNAWVTQEVSPDAGGLPYRFLIKSVIPASAVLLLIQGLAQMGKSLYFIFYKEDFEATK
ncbi:TRAP transporter small permease subunit [Hugenholtzia roseola]|uniref:TRAP transporter small permease subunit n=1 Tax=Hugenholtzia roseola TaxID=1002 RepID=UPI000421DD3A|nr:TRAP transporter small permease subunit [Hugenholtzia roseola]